MFGKIKCKQCGTVLMAENAIKESGTVFCSEEHAKQYSKKSQDKGLAVAK